VIDRLIGRPLHYAWLIVIVTFVTLITTAGFRATPAVLIVPLQDEFGWSRATISLGISLGLLMYGLTAPFSAALMDRFGVRRVMLVSLATIAAGASATTLMTEPWQFVLLWGLVVGGATGAVSIPLAATVANRWFSTRRGLVTGILSASNASGQMVFLPALAWLATAYGWRYAAVSVAAIALIVVFPIVAEVVRDRPQSIGLQPYGATEPVPAPERSKHPFRPAIEGLTMGLRSRDFWFLATTFFICGLSTNGLIGTNLIAAGEDHGLTAVALVAFAVFYGLDWVATVPPTVAITADTFGRERVGVVFAWIFAAHQVGAAAAAWAASASRTWLGTYNYAFVSAGILCLLAAGLSLRMQRPARVRGLTPEVVTV